MYARFGVPVNRWFRVTSLRLVMCGAISVARTTEEEAHRGDIIKRAPVKSQTKKNTLNKST